ncbi:hypothetical protein SYN63AY4M2_10035 [Synechococcus sp. 63AY4M2]|nr:hypothetical protein SYN63AY4M2_10035 [Synechococcus sp. 63AY4M2]PIK93191.1 hypothetical protein SYN65AY6LI_07515 [Synechococcus sp. 65AY6Li]
MAVTPDQRSSPPKQPLQRGARPPLDFRRLQGIVGIPESREGLPDKAFSNFGRVFGIL